MIYDELAPSDLKGLKKLKLEFDQDKRRYAKVDYGNNAFKWVIRKSSEAAANVRAGADLGGGSRDFCDARVSGLLVVALCTELDTAFTETRRIRVIARLKGERGLRDFLRVNNGPKFIEIRFTDWIEPHLILIEYIQPSKPNTTYLTSASTAPAGKSCSTYTCLMT